MLSLKTLAAVVAASMVFSPVAATQTVNITNENTTNTIETTETVVERPVDNRQLLCLARNIYFEAGNQSQSGMEAVANVVFNRMRDSRWPDTPCEVIYQRYRGVCQFSWVCSRDHTIRYAEQYQRAIRVAERALRGQLADNTGGSKFYHATYVRPNWPYRRHTTIGDHIFYRG